MGQGVGREQKGRVGQLVVGKGVGAEGSFSFPGVLGDIRACPAGQLMHMLEPTPSFGQAQGPTFRMTLLPRLVVAYNIYRN